MRGWWSDMRQSALALMRRPGFSAMTVLTLAAGIGTCTAIFTVAEALLLTPLDFEGADRLVGVVDFSAQRGENRVNVTYTEFLQWRGESDLLENAAVFTSSSRDLSGQPDPERLSVTFVSVGFFETLAAPPLLGRWLSDSDQATDAELTVVLSEGVWRRRMGSDSTVIGRNVRLNGVPHTVVGIQADAQRWPLQAQAWVPLRFGASPPDWAMATTNHMWSAIARLAEGVNTRSASARISSLVTAGALEEADERAQGWDSEAIPLGASLMPSEVNLVFLVMAVAVALVFLIACINASGLLMTHASTRTRELSLRSALGAGRGRIVRQLLSESLILAILGGGLGLLLAFLALESLTGLAPAQLARLEGIGPNATVLSATILFSILAALLAGLIPALHASGGNLSDALKEGSAQASGGRFARRTRATLVVAEIALSVVLLVAAGLSIRSFQQQLAIDPGFSIENMLSFEVGLPSARYANRSAINQFYGDLQSRLERIPGVTSVGVASSVPLGGGGLSLARSFHLEGSAAPPEGELLTAQWLEVGPEWFRTMGVSASAGRTFTERDDETAPLVALITEATARALDSEGELVGRRIRSWGDENLFREIVGVVPDISLRAIRASDRPVVIAPRAQSSRERMSVMIRTAGDPMGILPAARAVVTQLDPDLAVADVATMEDVLYSSLGAVRFLMGLFATFGLVALILAVSGVYGLVSFSVSCRTREIGVRMALGASAASVRGRVMREGGMLAGLGVTLGILLGVGFAKAMSFLLFGLDFLDPTAFGLGAGVLAATALIASYVPARRATRVDPVRALRAE